MNHLIYEVFNQAISEDEKLRSHAITNLSFILEMNSWNLSEDDRISRYKTLISKDIIKVKIDEQDQTEIVNFLCNEIVKGSKLTPTLLFSIGKATCKVAIKPLINIIEQHFDKFNENEVYQALISLERLLFFDETLSLQEEREILINTKLLSIISKKILSFQPISHSDLESTSLRFLARTILLLDGDFSS